MGAHAFDAWTRGSRPLCANESHQAEARLAAVSHHCDHANLSNHYASPAMHLERLVAASPANCRFRTVPAMLQQSQRYQQLLEDSGLLARCPHARCCGINQVAAAYNASDVTGVFVLDWMADHEALAALAFRRQQQHRRETDRRLAEHRHPASQGQPHSGGESSDGQSLLLVRFSRGRAAGLDQHVTCTCDTVPW